MTMTLEELLKDLYEGPLDERFRNYDIASIASDSRNVTKNGLFFALKGSKYNGADFIDMAVGKGACVVIGEDESAEVDDDVCYLTVKDAPSLIRKVTERFFKNPSSDIHTIGITGTNGKTTVSYLIESILQEAGFGCGVIGTINYRIGERVLPAPNTTPAFIENQKLLSGMINEGAEYCIMEVSSHALDQNRTDLIDFKTAVFTNLTVDHLDYHKTKDNYFNAKSKLFTGLNQEATAVINVDDIYGRKLISKTQSKVLTYGIENNADVMAVDVTLDMSGTQFKLVAPNDEAIIRTKLLGTYNVYNILAAIAVCLNAGIQIDKIKSAVLNLTSVPGRLESINCEQDFTVLIDYAHTQDALENVLRMIRDTSDSRIILVFGCGGDRDKSKRAAMGKVADQLADFSVVTSDNPRSEEPAEIIKEIVTGFSTGQYKVIEDREEAIKHALKIAKRDDIVLIAGKGHENYQIFKDRTIKFDERQIITQFLRC